MGDVLEGVAEVLEPHRPQEEAVGDKVVPADVGPVVYIGGFMGALLLRVFIVSVLYEAMATMSDGPGRPVGAAEAPQA
jgi:hypothetical protein